MGVDEVILWMQGLVWGLSVIHLLGAQSSDTPATVAAKSRVAQHL